MDTLFDLPETADPTVYVDPYPGKKGSDLVREECDRCHGTGQYPSSAWNGICLGCNGRTYRSVKVSSVRARVRRYANGAIRAAAAAQEAERNRPLVEWLEAEQAHKSAVAEAERIAALVTGFVAPVGEKIKGLTGTVTFVFNIEFYNQFKYRMDVKRLVLVTLEDGKVLKTISTGNAVFDLLKGDTVTVSGTVKAHDNYKGQDQTEITRARFTRN